MHIITRLDQITPDLTEIYITCEFQESFIGFQFPKKLRVLYLYNYSPCLIGVKFPESLKVLYLLEGLTTLVDVQFPHELMIIVACTINDPQFEFIKNEYGINHYTYLKYPRDHFIKPCLN